MDETFVMHSDSQMEKKHQCINVVASGHTAVNMSRYSLLQWINETLGTDIKKVEALCSGAEYCQLMDILFPGCIPMKKIKLGAKVMNEFWSNFKQLQIAFRAVGCEKDVPIDRLIAGRFQENFEFLQWFKRFFDVNEGVRNDTSKQPEQETSMPSTSSSHSRPVAVVNPVLSTAKTSQLEADLKKQIIAYQEKTNKVCMEKDFFFNKLRRIELLCTAEEAPRTEKKVMVEKILAELYSTDDPELEEE